MLSQFFEFGKNKTDLKTEILAGATTFLAAMYIIVVNPAILSKTGMSFSAVLTATVLVSAFCTIMMGIYAKNPILVAPGMGLNAFFTFSVVLGMGVRWETALGAVFWAGVAFMLLSIFNIRTFIVKAIPKQIRYAVSAGIGLFIALIGFVNAKFIVSNPATIVGIGHLDAVTITFLIGLLLTSVLVIKRVKGALIFGIILTTVFAIPIGRFYGDASAINFGVPTLVTWKGLFSAPDFSLIGKLDLLGSLQLSIWPIAFAFLFTDMFDSLSTFVGVAEAADLLDEKGEPRNVKQSLIVDAVATAGAGLVGSSAGTAYIESATGVEEGGRTGMTALTAGLLFIPFMFISPLLSIVPSIATSPALVLVGVFMMKPVLKINWSQFDDAIPAFLALVLIPFTYSITEGIIWGFLSWTVIKLALGKRNEVSPMLIVIDIFAIVALVLAQR
ncbi:MAG: NCS2 family permease [Ignavibacteria bacterium]|jgi:AGZA family xanthine/uracil permease-like MFS transporter|nr:NCS2 family permease [Ignavibacteria bacterium]MCU7498365.1 NCS2 family permease [Ignavibacteria bacterium]MCU7512880.1 NCS2 family permease [Ignavibacteria bacterium]MCU7520259.1 NCS2 family permease [Ignavibacteria bacterium]MCU7523620.1 NCS2 family permease [Ignavibacteria bacterium]